MAIRHVLRQLAWSASEPIELGRGLLCGGGWPGSPYEPNDHARWRGASDRMKQGTPTAALTAVQIADHANPIGELGTHRRSSEMRSTREAPAEELLERE